MTEPGYVAETLAWCNARRKEQERRPLKRLPKGLLGDPGSCPCGAATRLRVYGEEALGENGYFNTPRSVRRFVRAFDTGKLPQYEKAKA